jgi:hypothetical protein
MKEFRPRRRPRLAPSAVRPAVLALVRALGPLYAKYALHLDSLELRGAGRLVEAWRAFQEGRARLILAFRHPYGDEPQLFTYLFDLFLPKEARRLGAPLPRRPHARFVHGYEVPLWSGALVRWLLPRMGAVPVYHARFDSASVARIRSLASGDSCPLALAPEGQASYRSETLPRVEHGTARIAFWCAEELERAGRSQPVLVLPLSVHYHRDESEIGKVEALVAGVERRCGIVTPPTAHADARQAALKERLDALESALLGSAEAFYGIHGPSHDGQSAPQSRDARRKAVIREALRRAEAALGIRYPESAAGPSQDNTIDRVYRIRQEGWDRLYPDFDLGALAPLERELADRRAGEAWYAMRHMETVDLAWYLDSQYVSEGPDGKAPSFDRLVEWAYSLSDLASRMTGGDISDRPDILGKRVVVLAGEPMDLAARLPDYKRDRKLAVRSATADIAKAFGECIAEYLGSRGEPGTP